jgi:adenylylsulfate kinase-like enzyme
MRDDEIVLGVGDASAVEGEDVEVDDARTPARAVRIPAERELDALELAQQVDRLEIGLQLERRVVEARLAERVARRRVVERADTEHLADGPQLRDRRAKCRGRVPHVSPETDEGAHGARTLADRLGRVDATPLPVYVISGQLAAGKSTVAKAVLDRHPFGYHVDVDGIREMVTSGLASPLAWTDETSRQFGLAIRASAALARIYANAGFAVAIEGGIDPDAVESALDEVGLRDRMIGVVLRPRLDVALERNRARTHKGFDTSILEGVMREIDGDLARDAGRPGWHELDSSDQTIGETVDAVLRLASAAHQKAG